MLRPQPRHAAVPGFTLIEVLTVITIIAILVGLLIPVVSSVMKSARKSEASADETRIVTAVMSYQTDYGKLPLNSDNTGYVTCYGDPSDSARYPSYELFDILRAIPEPKYNINNQLNPRQVVYFQGNNVRNPSDPRSGFLLTPYNDGNYTIKAGSLVDPWGDEYMIWLDGSATGTLNPVMNPFFYTIPPEQGPPGPVQVSSMGPDCSFGAAGNKIVAGSDDVVTW